MSGKLFIVSTPIGNLKDITLRAVETLKSVDFILCESIKVSRNLLSHYQIKRKLIPLKKDTQDSVYLNIIQKIKDSEDAGYIVDAGTPCISDPGSRLVSLAIERGIEVIPIPGPSALVSALVVSGMPLSSFTFLGFVPHKKGRNKFLTEVLESDKTVAFYDSKHRIKKTFLELNELVKAKSLDPKKILVSVSNDLTKKFEKTIRGDFDKISKEIEELDPKGEFVITIKNLNK